MYMHQVTFSYIKNSFHTMEDLKINITKVEKYQSKAAA